MKNEVVESGCMWNKVVRRRRRRRNCTLDKQVEQVLGYTDITLIGFIAPPSPLIVVVNKPIDTRQMYLQVLHVQRSAPPPA